MSNLYSRIEELCKANQINITTLCKKAGINRGNLTDLKMVSELKQKAAEIPLLFLF